MENPDQELSGGRESESPERSLPRRWQAGDARCLRLRKLWCAGTRPRFWRALLAGVAPTVEHLPVLDGLPVDGIVDVGANRGQFTLLCRLAFPGVPVVAFEPIATEAARFRRVHGRAGGVELIECALGGERGTATLHLSRCADSSSLLPIGPGQVKWFPRTGEIGTTTVKVKRLDDHAEHWIGRTRQLLKLDVQGYELNVLRGGIETLKTCAYVYVECSEVELYEGQALRREVEAFLGERGFVMQAACNPVRRDGRVIQVDCLFQRPGDDGRARNA